MIVLLMAATAHSLPAAEDIPEVFEYDFDEVDPIKIYAGPVTFSHAAHVTDYGAACKACHHTLGEGETEVEEHCSDCHGEAGFIRREEAEGMSNEELAEHYLNALHMQCIGCHRKKKIADRSRSIPLGCTQCHDRTTLDDR
jgi:hypothetical protein